MDPITFTTLLAGKAVVGAIAAATTAMGFSSIVNAFTAKANRKHQEEMQAKQQQFQLALEEWRFANAANLQREIVGLQHQNALELQSNLFEEQRKQESYKRFCDNVWPLRTDPDHYLHLLKRIYSSDMMPLQIIVPATLESFKEIDNSLTNFFSDSYSVTSNNNVFYYNQGWKDNMAGRDGNAQVYALHDVLAGLPTLVLTLQKNGDKYSGRVSFWGITSSEDLPGSQSLFSISQKSLDANILRQAADRTIKRYQQYNIPLPEDKNIKTRLAEQQREAELSAQGNIPQEIIKDILNEEFTYSKAGKEELIQEERNKLLATMLEIVSAAFTDAYYLATYNIAPRIPQLCAAAPDFQQPQMLDFFQQIFDGLLKNLQADKLNTPLRYALVADEFKKNGFEKIADKYSAEAVAMLQDLLKETKEFAPQHSQAIELLNNSALTNAMKQLPGVIQNEYDEKFLSAIPLGNGVTLEMIKVKAGSFMMGSPENEYGRRANERLHRVTITKDYYLGKYPVTQAQWEAVMKGVRASQDNEDLSNLSWLTGSNCPDEGISLNYIRKKVRASQDNEDLSNPSWGSNCPVDYVSWNDVKDFCNKLNERYAGKLPVINGVRYQFDLPTEAQWEYACRAGTTTAYFWGNSYNRAEDRSIIIYLTVGRYGPNDWGFYDMHGNVCEWCRDWYNDDYGEDAIDPVGPSSGSKRVYRGGRWHGGAKYCRSACRDGDNPGNRDFRLGFRLALVPVPV